MSEKFEIEFIADDGSIQKVEILGIEKPEIDFPPISETRKIAKRSGFNFEKEICKVSGVPDFKTETWHQKVKVMGKTFRIPYPHVSTRTCTITFSASINIASSFPNIEDHVKECSIWAAASTATVIISSFASGVGAATTIPAGLKTFTETIIQCLAKKGIHDTVNVGIYMNKQCSGWR